jgi:hypothetical protein
VVQKLAEVESALVREIANMIRLPADAGSLDHDLYRTSLKRQKRRLGH